ncbi:ABC transporter, partial [Bittarella massiliensis]|nr:ABC transporter [Bittarella massiliensis (ex Durand et al. 2017)]
EPTANLDERGQAEIRRRLAEVESLLLVSHDRAQLDALCDTIWEVRDGQVRAYPGNYAAYRRQRAREEERAQQQWEEYTGERARRETWRAAASSRAR